MASLREYFETDFPHTVRMRAIHQFRNENIELVVHYDFGAETAFVSCYISGTNRTPEFFRGLVLSLDYGQTQFRVDTRVTLPAARTFPGELQIENKRAFEIRGKYFGDPDWISTRDIRASSRLFIYSETQLSARDISELKEAGKSKGHSVQFRSAQHASERSRDERPLAFISHDSRDKEAVARRIAINLQRMMCPVWYDDFSLQVGDRLRKSIEQGLKECRKCILVLSKNFFSNDGWTKTEFDSIFTRELLEHADLILPVWYEISKEEVFDYSPALLNIKGIDWVATGEDETCRQLHRRIMKDLD